MIFEELSDSKEWGTIEKHGVPLMQSHFALHGSFLLFLCFSSAVSLLFLCCFSAFPLFPQRLFGTYSTPGRDPRRHTVSVMYLCEWCILWYKLLSFVSLVSIVSRSACIYKYIGSPFRPFSRLCVHASARCFLGSWQL